MRPAALDRVASSNLASSSKKSVIPTGMADFFVSEYRFELAKPVRFFAGAKYGCRRQPPTLYYHLDLILFIKDGVCCFVPYMIFPVKREGRPVPHGFYSYPRFWMIHLRGLFSMYSQTSL